MKRRVSLLWGGLVFEMLERMGVVEPGQAPHLSYNVNGDFTEVEKHPDRVIPRTDPELFKKAADDVFSRVWREAAFPYTGV